MSILQGLVTSIINELTEELGGAHWARYYEIARQSNIPRNADELGIALTEDYFNTARKIFGRIIRNRDDAFFAIVYVKAISHMKSFQVVEAKMEDFNRQNAAFKAQLDYHIREISDELGCLPQEMVSVLKQSDNPRLVTMALNYEEHLNDIQSRERELLEDVESLKVETKRSCGVVVQLDNYAKGPENLWDRIIWGIKVSLGLKSTLADYVKLVNSIETYFSNQQFEAIP